MPISAYVQTLHSHQKSRRPVNLTRFILFSRVNLAKAGLALAHLSPLPARLLSGLPPLERARMRKRLSKE